MASCFYFCRGFQMNDSYRRAKRICGCAACSRVLEHASRDITHTNAQTCALTHITPAQTSSESQGGLGLATDWNSLSLAKTARIPNICRILHTTRSRNCTAESNTDDLVGPKCLAHSSCWQALATHMARVADDRRSQNNCASFNLQPPQDSVKPSHSHPCVCK